MENFFSTQIQGGKKFQSNSMKNFDGKTFSLFFFLSLASRNQFNLTEQRNRMIKKRTFPIFFKYHNHHLFILVIVIIIIIIVLLLMKIIIKVSFISITFPFRRDKNNVEIYYQPNEKVIQEKR